MKFKIAFTVFVVSLWTLSFTMAFAGVTTRDPGTPSISVTESHYEFEPVPDGTKVTHDFIVLNKGTAPLEITKVKTP